MAVVWCLSGGGIKGSFEVGAALALHSLRPDLAPDRIAGTSVGAINSLALAAYGFNEACGVMLKEYLELEDRKDMYAPAPSFEELLRQELLRGTTEKEALAVADQELGQVVANLVGNGEGEFKGGIRDAVIGTAVGGVVLGPLGAAVGGALAGKLTGAETTEDFDAITRVFKSLHGFFLLNPIAMRLRERLAAIDIADMKPVRFESVALEDGDIYAVDENGNLVTGLTRFSSRGSVELIGHPRDRILRGILASAAIPIIFNPVVVGTATGEDYTLVDGGLRNVLPVWSTLDLLPESPLADLVVISNSSVLSDHETVRWPIFSERGSLAYDYRPSVGARADAPVVKVIERIIDVRPRDGTDMARELLRTRSASQLIVEPTISIIGTAQVDPGLIRIWLAYGYLRAADELQVDRDQRAAFRWASDWITAARRLIWQTEDVGGPVALSTNRTLYFCIHALLAERERRSPGSVPPDADSLLTGVMATVSPPRRDLIDLSLTGEQWMLRDAMFSEGVVLASGSGPFDRLDGAWPRTRTMVEAGVANLAAKLATGMPLPYPVPDPQQLDGHIAIHRVDEIEKAVAPQFTVSSQDPPNRYPIRHSFWEFGTAVALGEDRVVVGGIGPFSNRIGWTELTGGAVSGGDTRPGPPNDPVVGMLDAISYAPGAAIGLGATIVRGTSGRYWITGGGAWTPVRMPREVELGRRDLPSEGHSAVTLTGGTIFIATQTSGGAPLFIETDLSGRTSRWRACEIEWRPWPGVNGLHREVVGSRLPAVALTGGGKGALVHAADGYVWWVPLRGENTKIVAEPVSRERFPFRLTGVCIGPNRAVLAGWEGDVLRRLRVRISDDGRHTADECPQVDLASLGLRHFGWVVAAGTNNNVIAVYPVQTRTGRVEWYWTDGCETGPPRTVPIVFPN
jgi:predicted acylesterase/phospholipase RssA